MTFQQNILSTVRNIKKGTVMTYGQVAAVSGNEKAARAVGSAMRKNQDLSVPCHRVVRSDGSIGQYNCLQGKSKREVLEKEGVKFDEKGRVEGRFMV